MPGMAEDQGSATSAAEQGETPRCPWCSAALPAPDAAVCPVCGARLVEAPGVEVPGVTAVDPALLAAAAAPRKIRRSLGSLLVGNDDEIPFPSEAELPALAPPDAEVRREILRLEMEARLASQRAEGSPWEAQDTPSSPEAEAGPGAPLAPPEQPEMGERSGPD